MNSGIRIEPHPKIDERSQARVCAECSLRVSPLAVYEPRRRWSTPDVREFWRFRELLYFLTWRDIKVRYKQTLIGATWAILQPFLTMVVFTVIFGRLINTPSDGEPYPVLTFAALLPWMLFATAISRSTSSIVSSASLITKVYFPPMFLPMAAVLAALVDFAIAFVVLAALIVYYGTFPGFEVLMLPLFILLAFAAALGIGLWLSALNVKYRDVGHAVPFVMQFWLFVTPVAYPSSLIPERWRTLAGLNPMAGVVEGFRWSLLGQEHRSVSLVIVSSAVVLVMLMSGVIYFRHMEEGFADVV